MVRPPQCIEDLVQVFNGKNLVYLGYHNSQLLKKLEQLPTEFGQLTQLNSLDLSKNSLEQLLL